MTMSPMASRRRQRSAFGPQIEDVVQVDVGEQRRDGRSLPRSPLRNLDPSVFENARPKPFLDQAENALVADAMFERPGEPFFAHRVERKHHRLPIPETFRLRSSSSAGGIPLKDAALPSSAA